MYASQSSGWFGQMIQRSDDGGTTWNPVGNQFPYDGVPGTHQWYDGTSWKPINHGLRDAMAVDSMDECGVCFGTTGEVQLELAGDVTQRMILDAVEAQFPALRGTIRDHTTKKRRDFIRFFACEEDLSHEPPDALLPEAVATGREPYLVVGAIAGGQAQVHQNAATAANRMPNHRKTFSPGAP